MLKRGRITPVTQFRTTAHSHCAMLKKRVNQNISTKGSHYDCDVNLGDGWVYLRAPFLSFFNEKCVIEIEEILFFPLSDNNTLPHFSEALNSLPEMPKTLHAFRMASQTPPRPVYLRCGTLQYPLAASGVPQARVGVSMFPTDPHSPHQKGSCKPHPLAHTLLSNRPTRRPNPRKHWMHSAFYLQGIVHCLLYHLLQDGRREACS